MGAWNESGSYSVNQSQSYKIVPLKDRAPGATERLAFRYILKGADGERIVSLLSPFIQFQNTGLQIKYETAPVLTAVAEAFGYRVSWPSVTNATYPNYMYTEIYESKTLNNFTVAQLTNSAVTNMGTSQANSISKSTGTDLAKRYVRIRHVGYSNGEVIYSPLSNVAEVTPTDPVSQAIDAVPPGEVVVNSAVWSGDNIVISATVDADSKRFIIKLQNGTDFGYFYKFPSGTSTSQTIVITSSELFLTFGQYYSSFNGVFQAADKVDNLNSGTAFTVGTRVNALAGVTPAPVVTAITNGYTVTWTVGQFAKVYEGSSSSFTPSEANQVYGGQSPAIVKKTVYDQVYVKVIFYDLYGGASNSSSAIAVTPINSISADIQAPLAPSSVSATPGVDSSGTVGFNGFLNISWPSVSDTTLRGYRIKFRPVTNPASEYSYVNSPGSGTSFRLGGLAVGATYEIAVASYDEFNNTTGTYTQIAENVLISGTPFIGTNVSTTGYFEAGVSGTDTGTFKFGYGVASGKRGLVFNTNNYWYIDSSQSALFKIGGASSNYVSWNGSTLSIDGNLGVAGGTQIGGNIQMASGGSIWSGALNGSGNLVGDGFLLSASGLQIKKGSTTLQLNTSDGGIYANYGQIAGWTIDTAKFERGSTGTYTGMSSSGTYAFWAGSPSSGGASNAKFYVTPAGAVLANDITITNGTMQIGSGFSVAANTGKLIASGADITGEIKADTGRIGNVNIGSGALYIGNIAGNRVAMTSAGFQVVNNGESVVSLSDSSAILGGWNIKGSSITSSGAYPMVIDSTNKKIVFAQGATDTFEIDSNSSITTYNVYQYIDYGDGSFDSLYDAYYTDWSGTTTSTSKENTIQIKKSSASGIQPMLTLSTQGNGIAQMSIKNGSDESEITLSGGGILLKASKKGGLKIPGLANSTAPHLNYSGSKAWVDGGFGSYPTDLAKQTGRTLTVKSDGTIVPSRAFFKSASSESTITTGTYFSYVGRDGDVIFSTGT